MEPKVSGFNDEYANKDYMIALLIKAFATIRDLDLPYDSMWFRKSNFFTLVVETAKHIDKLPEDFKEKLLALEEKVMANPRNNTASEFYKYYSYMYQATHGRAARVVRAEFFSKVLPVGLGGRCDSRFDARGVRGAVFAFGTSLDCTGASAAGESDPDALQRPLGTTVSPAPRLQPALPLVCGSGHVHPKSVHPKERQIPS